MDAVPPALVLVAITTVSAGAPLASESAATFAMVMALLILVWLAASMRRGRR